MHDVTVTAPPRHAAGNTVPQPGPEQRGCLTKAWKVNAANFHKATSLERRKSWNYAPTMPRFRWQAQNMH